MVKSIITEQTGPVSFTAMLESGEIWRRHVKSKFEKSANVMSSGNAVTPEPVEISHATPETSPAANETNVASRKPQEVINLPSAAIPGPIEPSADQLTPCPVPLRYPKGECKPPIRLGYEE